jgi:lysozyme
VLVNMGFNLGPEGLLGFRRTLRAVEEGRYADAAEGMLRSKWARQVGARAVRLAAMMREGARHELS